MRYLIIAEAYRDLEQLSSRLALTERLAVLLADTPANLLPTVCYTCQGPAARPPPTCSASSSTPAPAGNASERQPAPQHGQYTVK